MGSNPKRGLIFDIQRFSVHDGPGIRDLIFVKGCPLRCKWCSNPESQNNFPEISFNEGRCIGWPDCGRCLRVCPVNAISKADEKLIKIDQQVCTNCGKCAEVCPSRAIRVCGEYRSIEEILKIIEEDAPFYWRSGGGVTISGGELLAQPEFVQQLLKKCRERGINTAVETTGLGKFKDLEKVCQYANLILYDIKTMDPEAHKKFTGVSNQLILENLQKLACALPDIPIIVRTPIIPGFTDSEDNIKAIADFVCRMDNVTGYELLPYHRFGESKYRQLGREYSLSNLRSPGTVDMVRLRKIAQQACEKRRCDSLK